jgi:hypothetical protein
MAKETHVNEREVDINFAKRLVTIRHPRTRWNGRGTETQGRRAERMARVYGGRR